MTRRLAFDGWIAAARQAPLLPDDAPPGPLFEHASEPPDRSNVSLLAAALDGYNGIAFDHARHGLYTSDLHAAWCLGEHLQDTGRTAPRDVRKGRGDTMHANGMLWRFAWNNVKHPTITREN